MLQEMLVNTGNMQIPQREVLLDRGCVKKNQGNLAVRLTSRGRAPDVINTWKYELCFSAQPQN